MRNRFACNAGFAKPKGVFAKIVQFVKKNVHFDRSPKC